MLNGLSIGKLTDLKVTLKQESSPNRHVAWQSLASDLTLFNIPLSGLEINIK